jgi:hypothetical protein
VGPFVRAASLSGRKSAFSRNRALAYATSGPGNSYRLLLHPRASPRANTAGSGGSATRQRPSGSTPSRCRRRTSCRPTTSPPRRSRRHHRPPGVHAPRTLAGAPLVGASQGGSRRTRGGPWALWHGMSRVACHGCGSNAPRRRPCHDANSSVATACVPQRSRRHRPAALGDEAHTSPGRSGQGPPVRAAAKPSRPSAHRAADLASIIRARERLSQPSWALSGSRVARRSPQCGAEP